MAHALARPVAQPSPYAKFLLVASAKHTWREFAEVIARGAIPTAEPRSVSYDEAVALHPWAMYVCDNSFSVPTRALRMGWRPKHLDWRTDIATDVGRVLEIMQKG